MEHRTDERAVALLKGLDRRIAAKTTMPVQIAEAALACVACGFGSRTRRTARC
jgi:actin-like ATPase involved in cell morphogenesis